MNVMRGSFAYPREANLSTASYAVLTSTVTQPPGAASPCTRVTLPVFASSLNKTFCYLTERLLRQIPAISCEEL
jgi:hypothetical protein